MSTRVHDAPEAHRYEVRVDDELAGFAAYELGGDTIRFTHTEIDDAFGGRGIGKTLVTEALADAERRELRVVPVCPFVAKIVAAQADG